jgi:hypothetical protein
MGKRETEIMTLSTYSIRGFWGPRQQTPEAIALRFNGLIDKLHLLHPAFDNWIWRGANKKPIPFVAVRDDLAEKIAAAVMRHEDGDPNPVLGYSFSVLNSKITNPKSLRVSVHAGSWRNYSVWSNAAQIETAFRMEPDPTIVTYQMFKAALIAFAEAFEMTFCIALPNNLGEFWLEGPKFGFGWINYVAPRFAPLIKPPQNAIVEYRPNGGLLMSATNETFVTENPQHLAVAREIETALAPLNALPWPPDAEPESGSANE